MVLSYVCRIWGSSPSDPKLVRCELSDHRHCDEGQQLHLTVLILPEWPLAMAHEANQLLRRPCSAISERSVVEVLGLTKRSCQAAMKPCLRAWRSQR